MDIYKALAEAVGDDGLRRLGVTSGGAVVSNFNQNKLMEMSLAADAVMDAKMPAAGGQNLIPAWAVTHMGDEVVESASDTARDESDAEDAGIELGIDEQDGTMVPAAMFQGGVYYWTGDGFSDNREDGMSFTDADEADAELAKVEEFINSQMEESAAIDFGTLLSELKGNPWHDSTTGKFSSKDGVNSAGKGSLSLRGDTRSKQKVKGSGKDGPKMVKTPNICGRAARKQGLNVRCWTGTPFPAGFGKTPKNLTAKGMKTKNPGAGRGWRKGQNDGALGRRLVRGEWVDVDVKDVLFELDLTESETPSWSLVIEDKAAIVQQHGDADFVWEAYWIDADGENQVIASGDAETVEEAWSDAAVGMGLEFTEAAQKDDAPVSVKRLYAVGSGEYVPNEDGSRGGYTHTKANPHPKGSKKARAWEREQSKMGGSVAESTIQRVYNESDLGEESAAGLMRKLTFVGSRGDFESLKAEFDGEATFKVSGGTMVVKGDVDTLRRIKRYAENNLGLDIRESDEELDEASGTYSGVAVEMSAAELRAFNKGYDLGHASARKKLPPPGVSGSSVFIASDYKTALGAASFGLLTKGGKSAKYDYGTDQLDVSESSYESDLDKSKPVVVSGLKGMKSKPATKKFKNYAAYEKWLDKEDSEASDWTIQRVYNESEESVSASDFAPRWRKNTTSAIDRLRALGG